MNAARKIDEVTAPKIWGTALGCMNDIPLFSGLTEEQIVILGKTAQIRSHKKGKNIYLQGDTADHFYIICSGWIKLFRTMPEGDEVIIDMLTTRHMFGESAIFEQDCRMTTAQVIEDVSLLSILSGILKEQIHHNPQLALNMLSAMSRHHRHHVSALAFNTMLSAPQRIGCFLLQLCPPGDNRKNVTFNLPYDKTLIADVLGMKGATFSRALNILRQKTSIHIDGTSITVESVPTLARFVYGPMGTNHISADM